MLWKKTNFFAFYSFKRGLTIYQNLAYLINDYFNKKPFDFLI